MAYKELTSIPRLEYNGELLVPLDGIDVSYRGGSRSKTPGGMSSIVRETLIPVLTVKASYKVLHDANKAGIIKLFKALQGRTFFAELPVRGNALRLVRCRYTGTPKLTVKGSGVMISIAVQCEIPHKMKG